MYGRYARRAYYFEMVECARKLMIVCMPVFFEPAGSPAQLIFGLVICFLTSCAYSMLEPYAEAADSHLALLAQGQIFFALLASIALSFSPAQFGNAAPAMDVLLTVFTIATIAASLLLETPLQRLCYKSERERLRKLATRATTSRAAFKELANEAVEAVASGVTVAKAAESKLEA